MCKSGDGSYMRNGESKRVYQVTRERFDLILNSVGQSKELCISKKGNSEKVAN